MNKIFNEFHPILLWLLLILIIFILIFFFIHPILMTILLVTYTILISMNISIWKTDYIYSIILFLIIIRGLMIIFIYFSRLISNEKIIYFNKIILLIIILFIEIIIPSLKNFNNFILKFSQLEIRPIHKINSDLFINITNLYEYPYNYLTMLRVIFLILCFLLIIKLCMFKSFSIRKLNYDKI